jgi:hypothetical protein
MGDCYREAIMTKTGNEFLTNAAKPGAGKVAVSYEVNGSAREPSLCDKAREFR